MTSACPPSGEDPNDWVDCFEGKVRGTDTYCKDACGDDCCNGFAACDFATACIKKDGSCGEGSDFDSACYLLGYGSSYQIQISGPSCVGDYACGDMFKNNPNSGGVVSLTNSCTCDFSCHTSLFELHCSGDSPAPLPGLPACGDPFDDVGGQSISSCAVSCSTHCPSSILSFYLDATYSAKYFSTSSASPLCTLFDWICAHPCPSSQASLRHQYHPQVRRYLLHPRHAMRHPRIRRHHLRRPCRRATCLQKNRCVLLLAKIPTIGWIATTALSGELHIYHALLHVVVIAARDSVPARKPQLASRRMGAALNDLPALMQGTTPRTSFRSLAHPVSEALRVTGFFNIMRMAWGQSAW